MRLSHVLRTYLKFEIIYFIDKLYKLSLIMRQLFPDPILMIAVNNSAHHLRISNNASLVFKRSASLGVVSAKISSEKHIPESLRSLTVVTHKALYFIAVHLGKAEHCVIHSRKFKHGMPNAKRVKIYEQRLTVLYHYIIGVKITVQHGI